MSLIPTYEELEKRTAELEHQVELSQAKELKHAPEILSVLMEAFRYIPTCKTFQDAAREIFDQCKRLTGARSGYVALLTEDGKENEMLFLDAGGLPCDVDPDLPMPIRGLREVAYKTKAVTYENGFAESPWMEYMPDGHVRLDNVLFAPLNIEGKTVGVIGIANKPEEFNHKDCYIAKLLGDLAAVALTYAKAQDSLRESESRLKQAQKMKAIGTLAGGIAHEFNNILGIIIGNAELAVDDIPEWNPAINCIHEIRNASLRAKDVVRKLLSVARKSPSARKPIQISTIVKESLDLLEKTIPSTVSIQQNIRCTTETILADLAEIHQVLINLVTNAQHALNEETGTIFVSLEATVLDHLSAERFIGLKPGGHVKLTVTDDGEGIAPEIMDRVFDPYFTTKDVDKGLGMGLAVANGIIKKHDGGIHITSEVGKGTTVEVLFPLIEAQTEIAIEKSETLPTGMERILLVDDDLSILKMVTQIITRHGYKVEGRSSGKEALELFRQQTNRIDLVITDMAMPNMPGDRLAREIMKLRPDVPIILCTGHSDRVDERRAKELGINAFIMKPFSRADIVHKIREVLDAAKTDVAQHRPTHCTYTAPTNDG